MVKYTINVVFILFSLCAFSQKSSLKLDGYYTVKNRDTVYCQFRISDPNFKKNILYAKDKFIIQPEKGKSIKILPDTISSVAIIFENNSYWYSAVGETDSRRFVLIKSSGRVNLMVETQKQCRIPFILGSPSSTSQLCLYSKKELFYYISREDRKEELLTKENFKSILLRTLSDNEDLCHKIEQGQYNYRDTETIFEIYNGQ